MTDKRVNLKIWLDTLPKLRLVYALTGESMVSIVDRLISQELKRVQQKQQDEQAKVQQNTELHR